MGRPAHIAALLAATALTAGCMADGTVPPPAVTDPPGAPLCEAPSVPLAPARLLTRFEYDNTIRDLFELPDGDTLVPSAGFPPENRTLGFDNEAAVHAVSPLLVQSYVDAAERVADHVVSTKLGTLLPCDPAIRGQIECGLAFIDKLLPRAFRRPAQPEERSMLHAFFRQRFAESGFDPAVNLTLQVILQSPQFLYRLEPGDPSAEGVKLEPLEPAQLAVRLSYFLYASMPDEPLLAAVREGKLSTPAEIEAQARRMLADPKARRVVRHFHRQWLKTEKLPRLVKDAATFPEYDDSMKLSWIAAMDAYVEHAVLEGEGTLSALLLEPKTFVDVKLAELYGLRRPAGPGLELAELPSSYAGLLTQPALMAALANPDQSSPILRGIFVRERILCETLPPPPANIPIEPPDPDPGLTTRERFAEHTENDFCKNCHVKIDPIGFGFEAFDALGRHRELENGKAIDSSGELAHTEEPAIEGPFDGAVELSQRLAESEQVQRCVARQWFRFTLGRDPAPEDACSLANAERAFLDSGGSFKELLVALTLTDAFRFRAVEDLQ